jgi:hypothetical protein
MSSGHTGLDHKIMKEIEANEASNLQRETQVRLFDCIELKNSGKHSNKWEENTAYFETHFGMPAKGTKLYNWKQTQLSSRPAGLDHKIEKEVESNEGSIVWRDRKTRLIDCIASKRSG